MTDVHGGQNGSLTRLLARYWKPLPSSDSRWAYFERATFRPPHSDADAYSLSRFRHREGGHFQLRYGRRPLVDTPGLGYDPRVRKEWAIDTVSPERRSRIMSRVRGKDTAPELKIRRLVHRMGYRYRLHVGALPGRPDLVFPRLGKVILVHGCYWHRHPRCKLARLPKSRLEFWLPKLKGNRLRDLRNERQLRRLGWRVMTVWECELADQEKLSANVGRFLGA